MRTTFSALAAAGMMGLGISGTGVGIMDDHERPRHKYAPRYTSPPPSYSASINRHTGKPHEHKREIARNDRRAPALRIEPASPLPLGLADEL